MLRRQNISLNDGHDMFVFLNKIGVNLKDITSMTKW